MEAQDLNYYLNLDKGAYVREEKVTEARKSILLDASCSLGARSGLSRRSKEIRVSVEKAKEILDKKYPFQSIMLEYGVIPPIITEETRSSELQRSDQAVSYAGQKYTMIEPARFSLAPLTWRSYVYKGLSIEDVPLPNPSVLPKDEEERTIWKTNLTRCWNLGVEQANLIFENNVDVLKRDFLGMLRFKLLVLKGDISSPQVSTIIKGRENRGSELRIDQRDYEIKDPAEFTTDRR